ncbi:MAG: sugar kinase [Acidimicrobiia bacterium]
MESLSAVLDAVRLRRSRSRVEIAQTTGLSRAVVAQRVSELIQCGLLSERGTEPSTGGRPARRLRFEHASGSILAADLGATSIDVALTDLAGTILVHRAEPADVSSGPEVILGRVEVLFDEILAPGGSTPPVWGVGIGVPGPVEFEAGRPVAPPIMPGWDRFPVRERFAERYEVPVWVDNDVNLMALGEWRHGVARGHSNVVFIKLGTGIGAGLILDGRLHRGARGSAGDVGHIQVSDDPASVCRCGNIGCLEALAGGAALARDAAAAAREGRSQRLAEILQSTGSVGALDVAAAAAHGDPVSVELLQRAGRRIGSMLASVVNFFNPSLIVIGGRVATAGDLLLASIRETLYARSLPLATRDLLVQRSSLGPAGGVTGAAAMVLDELFAPARLAERLNDPAAHGFVEAVSA